MPAIAFYFLPVALVTILHAVTLTEKDSPVAGDSLRQNIPKWLFRKRSLAAKIKGPPSKQSEPLNVAVNSAEEGSPFAGDSPRQKPKWLFRKRNQEAAIRGPPSIKSESRNVAVSSEEEGSPLAADSPRQKPLQWLLRKRNQEAAIRGPPCIKSESQIKASAKRDDDGEWIWMPAYGYVYVRRSEDTDTEEPSDRTPNLFFCG